MEFKGRVLWIDDDYPSYPVISQILEEEGAQLETVTSLAGARERMAQWKYKLIIVDAILMRGGEDIGEDLFEGTSILRKAGKEGLNVIVLSVVPEARLRIPTTVRFRGYFNKIELGPMLKEFQSAVRAALTES